jgi:hypothetical protein
MDIAPPFGYQDVVALQRNAKVRLPQAGEVPAFARTLNAIPLSLAEFAPAMREYPIVFTSGDQGKTFTPVAVLGLAAGENLFVEGEGWRSAAYVPAYARRYPFCMAQVRVQDKVQENRLICVEKGFLDDAGETLFDEAGKALPRWEGIQRLLTEFEADLERTREACAILHDYALLEPFSMQATPKEGGAGAAVQLTGMHRVAEAKLNELNANQLKNLMRKGILARAYLHLVSLDNFARLLERRAARAPAQ